VPKRQVELELLRVALLLDEMLVDVSIPVWALDVAPGPLVRAA
jgi:hypothetical protein